MWPTYVNINDKNFDRLNTKANKYDMKKTSGSKYTNNH